MDTGSCTCSTAEQRAEVLSRTRSLGVDFVAGAFDEADVEAVQALGGTPVLFPSAATLDVRPRLRARSPPSADRFIGFELSPVFHPDGRIWDLDTYRAVLGIPQCIGAKHSSLERQPEWDRLRLRDEVRPDFLVLTGNDLAIDMVMYGSDYLLGLSTFAPAEFAARDRCWAAGDVDGFHRRNDVLQWLGTTAFRPPVPAYRHDAALFFQLRGWAEQRRHPGGRAAPRRRGSATSSRDIARRPRGALGMRRDYPQVKKLKRADAFLAHLDDARRHASPSPTRPTSTRCAAPIDVAGRPLRRTASPSSRWRGGTAPTTAGRPTSCAGAGSASARAAPGSCGAARRSRCARTGGPTPTSSASGPSSADDLAELHALLDPAQVTGLQLTHSGRWSVEPRPARRDPLLDARRTGPVLTAAELDDLADDYVAAARLAQDAGFDFVDVKACHGYLLHELLSGRRRPGRARPPRMRTIIERVRAEGIRVGVRLSAPSTCRPHRPGPTASASRRPTEPWGFDDPLALVDLLDVDLLCVTAGSPYYCPHAQRPAWFPPSDGYAPPEDPLVGVARLLDSAAGHRRRPPARHGRRHRLLLPPGVAAARGLGRACATAAPRSVGIGRMALSYPDLPADVLAGRRARPHAASAAPSATAPPRRATASCPGCFPSTRSTRSTPTGRSSSRPRSAPVPDAAARRRRRRARHRADARVVVAPDEGPLRRRRRRRPRRGPGQRRRRAHRRRHRHLRGGDRARRRRHRRPLHAAVAPPRADHRRPRRRQARRVREAARRLARATATRLAEAEAASAGRLMPIFQYRFGNGLQKVKALVDRGVAGPAYTVVGRGRVAPAGRLLRGAVARAVGDRARRRAAQPGGPRHRHAHLHRRPAQRKVFARVTTRVNDIEVEDCAAISLELADGSLATITATLGSDQEITRHRFHFANLSAESGTSAYESSADPWDIHPDDEAAAAAIAEVARRLGAARRGLVGPVRALRRLARRHRARAPGHPGRRPRVDRAHHRHVRLGPPRRRRRAPPLPRPPPLRRMAAT